MPETANIDGEPEGTDADAAKRGESDPNAGKPDPKETAAPVGDEGRPLIADDDANGHQHFRKRPVYKRPAYRARWRMSINLAPNSLQPWRRPRAPKQTYSVIKSFTAKMRFRDNNSMLP